MAAVQRTRTQRVRRSRVPPRTNTPARADGSAKRRGGGWPRPADLRTPEEGHVRLMLQRRYAHTACSAIITAAVSSSFTHAPAAFASTCRSISISVSVSE